MKVIGLIISLQDLQLALSDYAEKHAAAQPECVEVRSAWGKTLLTIPLREGATAEGRQFQQKITDQVEE